LLILFILFHFVDLAQDSTAISLNFRETHLSPVEKVLVNPDGKTFFTADAFGKILMWRTDNYKVEKVIQKSNGRRVSEMRLINNGNTLLVTSGPLGRYIPNGERMSYTFYTDGDQLSLYHPFSNDTTGFVNGSADILGSDLDPVIMLGLGDGTNNTLLILDKIDQSKELFRIESSKIISKAAITTDLKIVAISEFEKDTENDYKDNYTLKFYDPSTKTLLHQIAYKEERIINMVCDPEQKNIHVLIFNQEFKKMRIEAIDLESFKQKKYYETEMVDVPSFVSIQKSATNGLAILMSGLFSGDHIYHFNKNKLEPMEYGREITKGYYSLSAMAFIPQLDHLIMFRDINTTFGNNPEFIVWNYKENQEVEQFHEIPRTSTKGIFLPDENWMVFGTETNTDLLFNMFAPVKPYFKYYEHGTFNNRFGRLKFTDYLSRKFDVTFYTEDVQYALDESTGTMALVCNLPGEDEILPGRLSYVIYDLINDQIDTSNTAVVENMIPIGYNHATKRLLVKDYLNGSKYKVIQKSKTIEIDGDYMKAVLSHSGEYLLLLDSKGTLSVYSFDEKKIIYKTEIPELEYFKPQSVGTGDPNQFWVSYLTTNPTTSFQENVTLMLNCEDGKVSIEKVPNVWVTDIAVNGDQAAVLIDGIGIVLGENQVIPFEPYNFPYDLSINNAGDRLMVSMMDGTVQIYEMSKLKMIGAMNHPDSHSHLIIDTLGNFASNIETDDFLVSRKQEKIIALDEYQNNNNRPDKVLTLFGEPNKYYLELLKKSAEIHLERQKNVSVNKVDKTETFNSKNKKGSLYVLSIGISDYPGNEHDLTFADKDASDIAMLYADSTSIDLKRYQDRFLGQIYSIHSPEEQIYFEIRNYNGAYSSMAGLMQVDRSGRFWIEVINQENHYLWDFEKGTRKEIKITTGMALLEPVFISDPSDKGFCFLDNDTKWNYYSFETGTSRKIEKPEDPYALYLGNDEWLKTTQHNESPLRVEIESVNGKNGDRKKYFEFVSHDENNFELLAASGDQTKVLVKTFSNLYLLSSVNGKSVIDTINWKGFDNCDLFSFTKDNSQINCFKTIYSMYSDNPGKWLIRYHLENKTLDSVFYADADVSAFIGLNNTNGEIKWVNVDVSISKQESLFSESAARETINPVSFEQTYVQILLNEEATQSNIQSALKDISTKIKPEDELIVFMAGHGLLDTNLHFHYATYDMDFNNPDEKGFSYQSLMKTMGEMSVAAKLLLLDACHSGDVFSSSGKSENHGDGQSGRGGNVSSVNEAESTESIADVYDILFGANTDEYGVTVIAASSGKDLAIESREISNGAFTAAYIESILTGFRSYYSNSIDPTIVSPVLLSDDLIYFIRKKVIIDTDGQQIPNVRSINKKNKIFLY